MPNIKLPDHQTLKPPDEESIIAAARRTGCVVTAEDHTIIGSLGRAVAETLCKHYPLPMKRVGWRDVFGESALNQALLEKYGFAPRHIADAARELLYGGRHHDYTAF